MAVCRHWVGWTAQGEVICHFSLTIHCLREARDLYAFSGKGDVYSYTSIYDAPSRHDANAPFTTAPIRLEEAPTVTAELTDMDMDSAKTGTSVEMVTRRMRDDGDERGLIFYSYKFRPAALG